MNDKEYKKREQALKETYWNHSDKNEFDSLHDILVETDLNIPKNKMDEAIKITFMKLPEHIFGSVISWGLSDTGVRDEIYEFVLENHEELFDNIII